MNTRLLRKNNTTHRLRYCNQQNHDSSANIREKKTLFKNNDYTQKEDTQNGWKFDQVYR